MNLIAGLDSGRKITTNCHRNLCTTSNVVHVLFLDCPEALKQHFSRTSFDLVFKF